MNFVIKEQRYPTADGSCPLSYGIFLETESAISDLEYWQDCDDVFVVYSRTHAGAERAIKEFERIG